MVDNENKKRVGGVCMHEKRWREGQSEKAARVGKYVVVIEAFDVCQLCEQFLQSCLGEMWANVDMCYMFVAAE